jgi:arylsulfatase A-like enzyme
MPGQVKSITINGPVSHIDLLPTILDIMDEEIPGHLQGRSLRPAMEGEAELDDGAIIEWNSRRGARGPGGIENEATVASRDPTRTIVTPDGWRFTCSPTGWHELYNLNEDPIEIHNLARSGEHDGLMSDLLEKIRSWQRRTGDRVRLPVPR